VKAIDRIGSAFLRKLVLRMKALGLSQTALARRMKVSRPYVTKVLSGDVNISFRTAAKFAHALQLDFLPVLKPVDEPVGRGALLCIDESTGRGATVAPASRTSPQAFNHLAI
jgi:transcriptional regulator with XRE-family HTH domain